MSRLRRPLRRFITEAAWLSREFSAGAASRTDGARLACEMVVIRLHDCWARSCRDLVICSALGNTTTLGGVALRASPLVQAGEGSVVPALLATYQKGRKAEPKWFDVFECVNAAERLKVNNLSTIAAGLGAMTSPAESLRAVRNFYAHRGKYTAQEAGRQGIFANPNIPDVLELAGPSRPGMSRLDLWIAGLTDTLRAACQ